MENKKTFYKKCPVKGCNVISGFYPTQKQIDENGKYYCQDCEKESKLSNWKESSEEKYLKQISKKSILEKIEEKLNKKIIPAKNRKYGRK